MVTIASQPLLYSTHMVFLTVTACNVLTCTANLRASLSVPTWQFLFGRLHSTERGSPTPQAYRVFILVFVQAVLPTKFFFNYCFDRLVFAAEPSKFPTVRSYQTLSSSMKGLAINYKLGVSDFEAMFF
jgi:hypothetical protein